MRAGLEEELLKFWALRLLRCRASGLRSSRDVWDKEKLRGLRLSRVRANLGAENASNHRLWGRLQYYRVEISLRVSGKPKRAQGTQRVGTHKSWSETLNLKP